MKCPIDGTELVITERQGVEIDYCPQCRGVWLDRGELDKIIERAEKYDARDRSRDDENDDYQRRPNSGGGVAGIAGIVGEVLKEQKGRSDDRHRDDRYRDDSYDSRRKKKKGGILGELFDF